MPVDLKKEIKEIAEIAKGCPEEFRIKCFEILLEDALGRAGRRADQDTDKEAEESAASAEGSRQFKAFCKQNSFPADSVENVFDFPSEDDFIRVGDFKQNTKSKQQIVIALLTGVRGLQKEGVPSVPDKLLRAQCKKHDVYDRTNFTKHMGSYKKYFTSVSGGGWKLTSVGTTKAAEIVKSLGGGGTEFKL